MVARTIKAVLLTLIIFHLVAYAVYGTFAALTGLEPPAEGSPGVFMLSVFVQKLGHAITFVLIFYLAREPFSRHWLRYAIAWCVCFFLGEIGQAIMPSYSWQEAIAGIISEAVYFPLAAFSTNWLIGMKE